MTGGWRWETRRGGEGWRRSTDRHVWRPVRPVRLALLHHDAGEEAGLAVHLSHVPAVLHSVGIARHNADDVILLEGKLVRAIGRVVVEAAAVV